MDYQGLTPIDDNSIIDKPAPESDNNIFKYKEFYNLNGYYVKIFYENQKIIIRAYDINSLDGIKYECKKNINDILSNYFKNNSIEEIIQKIIQMIENGKYALIKKENYILLSLIINDILKLQIDFLLNYDKKVNNEYIDILANEIRILRNNNKLIKELKDENMKIKSDIEQIKKNKKVETPSKDIIVYDEINKKYNLYSNIKELDFSEKNYNNEIIEYLANIELNELKILLLYKNNITDISKLKTIKIEKLEKLSLHCNKISDISVLGQINFQKLKELWLYDNNISEINCFQSSSFENLELLSLTNNKISDIKVFGKVNFKELKELYLGHNKINDINALKNANMNNIQTIYLNYNEISDIGILSAVNFKELKCLNLGNNKIKDIKCLVGAKFEKLEQLGLNNNQISDIDILEKVNLKQLKELYLNDNNIRNINSLQNIKTTSVFSFFNYSIFDNLELLYLYNNQIEINSNSSIIENLKSKIKDLKI